MSAAAFMKALKIAAQKAEKKAAKKAARKAEKQAGKTAGEVRPAKEVIVSPLAPDRFPDLPVIKGVKFAAASAGIKYQDRTDVMLVRLPPGTSIAGAFTRSSTRAASILDCQEKLTGTQEAAWKTYIAAATPPAPPARPDRAQWEKLSAPERMEKMMTMMKEREGHMATHLAAMKTFYATLSPLQQQIFNDNVGGGMRGHGHGHGRG